MNNQNPYEVLEISESAKDEEIKKAYYKLAKKWHPDNYPNGTSVHEEAEEKMKKINAAHDQIILERSRVQSGQSQSQQSRTQSGQSQSQQSRAQSEQWQQWWTQSEQSQSQQSRTQSGQSQYQQSRKKSKSPYGHVFMIVAVICILAFVDSRGLVFSTKSGTTGNLSWTLTGRTLTISGYGAMPDYNYYNNPPPWFKEHGRITTIVIENSVTSVGNEAFRFCKNIKKATMSQNINYIGIAAFGGCKKIKNLKFPDSLTYLGECAFIGCYRLSDVTIPDSVTYIGSEAFYSCHNLKSVSVPENAEIGARAFPRTTEIIRRR